MALRREIDDVARHETRYMWLSQTCTGSLVKQISYLSDERPSQTHITALTGQSVCVKIARKRLLELRRQARIHHADTVHRVDQGFDVSLKDVTVQDVLDHL